MSLVLKARLLEIPHEPGVYLMKNASQDVIYIGKAKDLKKRLGSYFSKGHESSLKTKKLVENVKNFDVILVHNEVEALLLERSLIREHQPHYNVLLRDDKEYPYVRVDVSALWPRITKVRRRSEDQALYIGPFTQTHVLYATLQWIFKNLPIVRCSEYEFKKAKQPCHYYHMQRCLAPCTKPVDRNTYLAFIESAIAYLRGEYQIPLALLTQKMYAASEQEDFESAAVLRDQIHILSKAKEIPSQDVIVTDITDADIIALIFKNTVAVGHMLQVRKGRLIGSDAFDLTVLVQSPEEVLEQFLIQFYQKKHPPSDIFMPFIPDGLEGLQKLFPATSWHVCDQPLNTSTDKLMAMAFKNAEQSLVFYQSKHIELASVQERLGLTYAPERVECIDISNLGADSVVASCVCFIDGKPAKSEYRLYHIKTTQGQNDFGAIKEVMSRRVKKILEGGEHPQLMVIDGGKGQLSSALEALEGVQKIRWDIIAIAKSKVKKNQPSDKSPYGSHVSRSYERIFFPHNKDPWVLKTGSPEYRLLTQIRDEAHRFALAHHRKKRQKKATLSSIESIPGVGKVLKIRLLESFGSVEQLSQVSLEALIQVKGISSKLAEVIYVHLRSSYNEEEKG